jgi:epoxyqueuosine reductase
VSLNQVIEDEIKRYVATSPNNRLPTFDEVIWDEPLVGFADGDDSIFTEYKDIIGDFHMTPREALETHVRRAGYGEVSRANVISWVLPSTAATRLSLRRESTVPSLRWNHTRFQGQDFNFRLQRHLAALIEGMGYRCIAPELEKWWQIKDLQNGLASNWSQRHVAYAAGLGTFGLSDGFITPKGVAIRVGSVVCDLELTPSQRTYAHYRVNCLHYREGSCGRCIQRCPAGAISTEGHERPSHGGVIKIPGCIKSSP